MKYTASQPVAANPGLRLAWLRWRLRFVLGAGFTAPCIAAPRRRIRSPANPAMEAAPFLHLRGPPVPVRLAPLTSLPRRLACGGHPCDRVRREHPGIARTSTRRSAGRDGPAGCRDGRPRFPGCSAPPGPRPALRRFRSADGRASRQALNGGPGIVDPNSGASTRRERRLPTRPGFSSGSCGGGPHLRSAGTPSTARRTRQSRE
jgi:hypothetical protein